MTLKAETQIMMKPRPGSILPMTKTGPSIDRVRPKSAVSRLRNLNFHENLDWWGLLAAVSRESGFSVTKIEERSESCASREEGGMPLVQTLVQCTTEPVLGNYIITLPISFFTDIELDHFSELCLLRGYRISQSH